MTGAVVGARHAVSNRRESIQSHSRVRNMSEKAQPGDQRSDFPPKLSAPAQRALAGAGYYRLEQLTRVTEADLKKLHGMGPKAIAQLRQALADAGWDFADGS